MLPIGIGEDGVSEKGHIASLNFGYPIVMYSHGQAGTRFLKNFFMKQSSHLEI